MTKIKEQISSNEETVYFVIAKSDAPEVRYGIFAQTKADLTDADAVEDLFFTQEEAKRVCVWLAENDVYPCVLKDVIADRYYVG